MERSEPFRGNISEQITDDSIPTSLRVGETGLGRGEGRENKPVSSQVSLEPPGVEESP